MPDEDLLLIRLCYNGVLLVQSNEEEKGNLISGDHAGAILLLALYTAPRGILLFTNQITAQLKVNHINEKRLRV